MISYINHKSKYAANDNLKLKAEAVKLPYLQHVDSLYEVDDGVEVDSGGGIIWHNKITYWDGITDIADRISGNNQKLDSDVKMGGHPTIKFPYIDSNTPSKMLVSSNSYALARNMRYSPPAGERKITVCAVFKSNSSKVQTPLTAVAAHAGSTYGNVYIMGIVFWSGNAIWLGTFSGSPYYESISDPEWYDRLGWTIFVWHYDMDTGDATAYINGIEFFDGMLAKPSGFGGNVSPDRAGIGKVDVRSFFGNYAALVAWNYNLTPDARFYQDVTKYFQQKYGIQ